MQRRALLAEALEPRVLLSAQLFKDFVPGTFGSEPQSFFAHRGDVYFSAVSAEYGRELWKTDGTPAGTRLVKDVVPGAAGSNARPIASVGGLLLFSARTSSDPFVYGLFTTDGTPEGTRRFNPAGFPAGGATAMASVGDVLYLYADDLSVWRTDGTPEGTRPLPAKVASHRRGNVAVAAPTGTVYFAGTDADGGDELWRTDGTPSGTRRVKDTLPGPGAQTLDGFVVAGGSVYYTASPSPGTSLQIWRTDGTEAGTFRVQDLVPAGVTVATAPEQLLQPPFAAARNGLLFLASDPQNGTAVWLTDGTPSGTHLVNARPAGTPAVEEFDLTSRGGDVFFLGNSPDGRRQLMRSDGTLAGTTVVADLGKPDWQNWPWGTYAGGLRLGPDGMLYFGADETTFRSDGTPAGTVKLFYGLRRLDAVATGTGRYVYAGLDPLLGNEPFSATGFTPEDDASVTLLADVNSMPRSSNAGNLVRVFSIVLFNAYRADGKQVLYRTDGSDAGTRPFSNDPDAFPTIAGPSATLADGRVVFAGVRQGQTALWLTNSAEAGTFRLANLPSGAREMMRDGQYVYVNTVGGGLWRTDGTAAGTVRIVDDAPAAFRAVQLLGGANGLFYFAGLSPETGTELYATDGTPQGTRMVTDLRPGPNAGLPPAPAARALPYGGSLYFAAFDGPRYQDLWKTDGTAAGTVPVNPAHAGLSTSMVGAMYEYGGLLYYSLGHELWRTDGTAGGTVKWAELPRDTQVDQALVWNGAIYLDTHRNGIDGRHILYRSDGTAAGTTVLKDFGVATNSRAGAMTVAGNVLLLAIPSDDGTFADLWRTDGTPAGTVSEGVRVGNHPPGSDPDFNRDLVALKDAALFASADWARGAELWKWAPDAPAAAVVGRSVFYNNSVFDGHSRGAGPADDNAVAPDKAPAPAGATVRPEHHTSYARGINGVMIDVRGLPAGAQLTAADFAFAVSAAVRSLAPQSVPLPPQPWRPAPAPSGITVRRGAGVDRSDRVTLVWPDGTFQNTWLRVTVNATANTGLAQPDVSYVGNLVGDANGDGSVTVNDYRSTVSALFSASPLSGIVDFDRDGRVGLADLRAVRANLFRRLPNISTPVLPAPLIQQPNTRVESTSLPPAVGGGGSEALLAAPVRTQVLNGDVPSVLA